jgi:hypothetical protein
MKLEYHPAGLTPRAYYTVAVAADELKCTSRPMPYAAWIGVIDAVDGTITLWHPAASRPRGYAQAAMRMLIDAREEMFRLEKEREKNVRADPVPVP